MESSGHMAKGRRPRPVAWRSFKTHPNGYACYSRAEKRKLLDMAGPAVIVAGSGMCNGGRILDHLRRGLSDPKNDVIFVGLK
jgi:predicted metal-dependent RNase